MSGIIQKTSVQPTDGIIPKTLFAVNCYRDMKRVLVCDDDQDVLFMVTFVLTGIGWEVFTSIDCKNIINKTLESLPSIILMDINFPEENGVTASQILKKHPNTKHIPIILFSSDSDIITLANEACAELYLVKPFEVKKLESIAEEAYKSFKSNDGKFLKSNP